LLDVSIDVSIDVDDEEDMLDSSLGNIIVKKSSLEFSFLF